MPIIAQVGRKKRGVRALIFLIYLILSLGAISILYPFVLMVASSFTTRIDYDRFELVPLPMQGKAGRYVAFLAERYGQQDWPIFQANYQDPRFSFWDDLSADPKGFFQRVDGRPVDQAKMLRYRDYLASLSPNEFGLYSPVPLQDRYEKEIYQPTTRKLTSAETVVQINRWLPPNNAFLQADWFPPDTIGFGPVQAFRKSLPVEQRAIIGGRTLWLQWLQANRSLREINQLLASDYHSLLEVPFLHPALREEFLKNGVPARLQGSLPEIQYARFLGSDREWVDLPAAEFDYYLFQKNERSHLWASLTDNYRSVLRYLFTKGRAAINTIILVVLSVGTALIVNPLAAYALARFRLRATPAILLFCLATTAFPAEVSMIPSFLLLKELGLLNTFAALVLPAAASGFTIFLLKGFFESLPQELYEAADIDGAGEIRKFLQITIPLCAPILAVSALGAFTAAYTGYMWAFIVAQKEEMWTIMVWLFQFQTTEAELGRPSVGMAALVVASLPTLIVFLFCQKIIMRGIIVPSMK